MNNRKVAIHEAGHAASSPAFPLVILDGEPRVDSRQLARPLVVEHKALYRLLRRYHADFHRFGFLRFDQTPIGELTGRARPEKFVLLNQAQALRLLTYFDDFPEINELQTRLLHTFGGAPPAIALPEQCPQQNGLIPFSFESRAIRFIPEGDSFSVVAKDVLLALEYADASNPARVIAHVPEEWKGVNPIHTLGGIQDMLTLTEQGFYFFVNRSDKPKALPLQKWVAGDVLPSIRKTGGYTLLQQPRSKDEALFCYPLSHRMQANINRRARALANEAKEAMQEQARHNPRFNPEHWQPAAKAADSPALETDPALQIARQSRYRTRNPQRDYEVLKLRMAGMTYREIGEKMGISFVHASRIVRRQAGKQSLH